MKIEYNNSFCIDSVLKMVMKENKKSKEKEAKKHLISLEEKDEDDNTLIEINLEDKEDEETILDSGISDSSKSLFDYLTQE